MLRYLILHEKPCSVYATVLGVFGEQQGEGKTLWYFHLAQNLDAKKEPV